MDRMKELIKVLNEHSYNYYVLDNPTIADVQYDKLYDELLSLEKESGIVLDNSPTRRVGGTPLISFDQYVHKHRLYSLDKGQTHSKINEWIEKVLEKTKNATFSVEYKFDGLTMNLSYNNGIFLRATTRGNGIVGEDVTAQVLTIKTFPLTIDYKGELEVVGEGIMTLSTLKKYNESATVPLKNARNGVAGAIRNLDPKETARRNPQIVFYSINYIEDENLINSQKETIEFLKKNKFKVSDFFEIAKNSEQVINCIEKIHDKRDSLDFLIDGAVIKVNENKYREELGFTEKFPKWAIAYKYEAEETTTKLIDVVWQVGRTGKVTPLALLDSVDLGGVTVSKATLNNYNDIERKGVCLNDFVFIRRSNDVIPEITGSGAKTEQSIKIEKPIYCPICNTKLIEKGANLFCPNEENCQAQVVQRITHFASKNAMDIEGFSESTATKFFEKLNIKFPYQLFYVVKEDLMKIDGFKDKKAGNILNSIAKARAIPFDRFIYSLGILNVGSKTAKDLAKNFENIDKLKSATLEELLLIQDIGEIVAQSILEYFSDKVEEENLNLLLKEVDIKYDKKVKPGGVFSGEKVVLTGKLSHFGRSGASKIIEDNGGEVLSSVTKNTTLVVVGEDAGSKLEKAQKLNIKIIDEKQFMELVGRA